MIKTKIKLALLSTFFCTYSAFADEPSVPDGVQANNEEKKLVELFENSAAKALTDAQAKRAPAPQEPKVVLTPVPVKETSDQLISRLASKVEELRSKSVMLKAAVLNTQRPKQAKLVSNKVYYSYKEGDVYEVRGGVDRVTDVELQPGESLNNAPVAGDTVRWKLAIIKSGSGQNETTHIMVKPLDTDIETNIVLTTNRHVYHIRAISSDWYMPAIAWHYPQEEDAALEEQLRKQQEKVQLTILPEDLHFDYDIDGDDYDWKPVRVFDDGQKTFIQMPKSMRVSDAPALFVTEDNTPMLVNYRVKGDYYIVDRLFAQAELRVGTKRKVEIEDKRKRKSFFERIF